MIDERFTSAAISAVQPEIAVLGIGAIEQHGSHLPIGTDWLIACELSRRVALELNALLLPAVPFSMSECHGSLAGTVWIKPDTLAALVHNVSLSLHEQGIHNLLLINGHGGNFVLEPAIQAVMQEFAGMTIILPPEIWPGEENGTPIFDAHGADIHGGEVETSILLYLASNLVKSERVDFIPNVGREFLDYVQMDRLSPVGIWGTPSMATIKKGERTFISQVAAITSLARQAFARKS